MDFTLQVTQIDSIAILDALDRYVFDNEVNELDKEDAKKLKEKLLQQIQQQFEDRRVFG